MVEILTYDEWRERTGSKRTVEAYAAFKEYDATAKKAFNAQPFTSGERRGQPKPKAPQFVPVFFKALEDPEWLKANRNKTTTYLLLLRYVCGEKSANDPFDLYNRYFKNDRLATSISEQKLADLFGYKGGHRKQVHRWLNELEKEGAFSVVRVKRPYPMKPKKIYIVGRIVAGRRVYDYL